MANAAKVAGKVLTQGDLLHILPFYGLGDDSEKKAREAAEKQKEIEQQTLDYAKQVAGKNQDIWGTTASSILGNAPVTDADVAKRKAEQAAWDAQYGAGAQTTPQAAPAFDPDEYAKYVTAFNNGAYGDPNQIPMMTADQYQAAYHPAPAAAPAAAPPPRPEDLTAYDPNTDPNTLEGAYRAAGLDIDAATKELVDNIGNIQDPQVAEYVGDIIRRGESIKANPEELLRQKRAADKLEGYTNVQETAEERLMRELARRKMEGQLKSDRLAAAQNLQRRGVYGSGAEIAMGGQSMQEAASRRAMEELAAQANAQNRAMNALGKFSDLSSQMRTQDVNEAEARAKIDQVADMFNKGTQEQHNQFKTKQEAELNRDRVTRDIAKRDAKVAAATAKTAGAQNVANTKIALASGATGSNISGANTVIPASNRLGSYYGTEVLKEDAKTPQPGMLGDFSSLWK